MYENITLKIRIATLIALCGGVITLGIELGNWQEWRHNTDGKIDKLETSMQSMTNERRAAYNRNIQVK